MLTALTAADVPDFTAACAYEPVFGSRILTAWRAYGLHDADTQFYLCRAGRKATAALCLAGGVLSISADADVDPTPIAALARRAPVREIDCDRALCDALQTRLGGTMDSSYYMVYHGAPVEETTADFGVGALPVVFDILQRSHEYYRTHLDYPRWSADWQRRLSAGLSEVYLLVDAGEPVGTGAILSEDERCGVLGAVAVVPEHRHRGLGSRITRLLMQRIGQKGKIPRLIAGYDEVAELYRKLGFVPYGRWGELYLD